MATRVSHHTRSGLSSHFYSGGGGSVSDPLKPLTPSSSSSTAPLQRRFRTASQTQTLANATKDYMRVRKHEQNIYSSGSGGAISKVTPQASSVATTPAKSRSVSAHRITTTNTTPNTPLQQHSATRDVYFQRKSRTPRTGVTPHRPNRGPIITPNRKASAPPKLISSDKPQPPPAVAPVAIKRRPTPHPNAISSTLFQVHHQQPPALRQPATLHRHDHSVDSSANSSSSSSSSNSCSSTTASVSSSGSSGSSSDAIVNSRSIAGAPHVTNRKAPPTASGVVTIVPPRTRKTTVPAAALTYNNNDNKANSCTSGIAKVSGNKLNVDNPQQDSRSSASQNVNAFYIQDQLNGLVIDVNTNNSNPNNINVLPITNYKKFIEKENILPSTSSNKIPTSTPISILTSSRNNKYNNLQQQNLTKPVKQSSVESSVTQSRIPSQLNGGLLHQQHIYCAPSLSPILGIGGKSPCLSRSDQQVSREEHEAAFLDEPPGADEYGLSPAAPGFSSPTVGHAQLRLSKDHGGGRSHHQISQDSDEYSSVRKTSAPAVVSLAPPPSKRGPIKDAPVRQQPNEHGRDHHKFNGKEDKFSNPVKYKTNKTKMSAATTKLGEGIPESNEIMDVDVATTSTWPIIGKETTNASLKSASGAQTIVVAPVKSYSGSSSSAGNLKLPSEVSATITINSIVPELSSTASPAVNASTKLSANEVLLRNSKDATDSSSRKQAYAVEQVSPTATPESVKSVSITKLEITELSTDIKKNESTAATSKISSSNHLRKLSPSKNYPISSDFTPTCADDSFTRVSSSGSKKLKKDYKENDEAANARFQAQKLVRMEKMVSDLVKNAEVKKQEIAGLRMETKRLKEAAREQQTDEQRKTVAAAAAAANSNDTLQLSHDRMDDLLEENRSLRSQLLHFGGSLNSSRLSDQEKEAILKGGSWGERSTTGATIGDWDAKSSSSEVSVACLQDRIMQMEETHYCTNEELQATLQELDDLRDQLTESQARLHQVTEDKQVVVDSLHEHAKSLEVVRFQNSTFKQLLIQHSENSHSMSNCVSSQKLLELLKTVEEDHERLLTQKEDLKTKIGSAELAESKYNEEVSVCRDRLESIEAALEAANAKCSSAESQASDLQETVTVQRLETARMQAALTMTKEKVGELEARLVGGGAVGEVLEVVSAEKERLEQQVADLTQQQHAANNDNDKIREQMHQLQEKLKKAESRALAGVQDASERLAEERRVLLQRTTEAEGAEADARATAQRHLHSNRELKTALADVQKRLAAALEAQQRTEDLSRQHKEEFQKQAEEWDQFQCDLLTTVRVANDFKTEAQAQLEKVKQENALLKHQLCTTDKKLPGGSSSKPIPGPIHTTATTKAISSTTAYTTNTAATTTSAERRATDTKQANPDRPLVRADSRVKSLIESLEGGSSSSSSSSNGSGSSCTSPRSRCSPTGMDGVSPTSPTMDGVSPTSPTTPTRKVAVPLIKRADAESGLRPSVCLVSSPLKETGNIEPTSSRQLRSSYSEGLNTAYSKVAPPPSSPTANLPDTVKMSQLGEKAAAVTSKLIPDTKQPQSILSNKGEAKKHNTNNNYTRLKNDKKDPLALLAQGGGSKRNALLKWCQSQTLGYKQVDITNFSSSWNDGLALCAILDTYVPEKINYRSLNHADKRPNFEKALAAAESVGISSTLDINDMMNSERPNWQTVYNYVTSIYAHFET